MPGILDIRQKQKKIAVGLNSGTSCDGIDVAIVEIDGVGTGTRVKLLAFENVQFEPVTRQKISALFDPRTGTVDRICGMNFYLGELFAAAALKVIDQAGFTTAEIDFIGSHGQTIYHIPNPVDEAGRMIRSTLQIGEPAVIGERTGIVTVADFRVRDMAAGGQGAPLTSYADYLLFGQDQKTRLIQNIGGIGNVTLVGGKVPFEAIMAFDTGPGNMIIDQMINLLTQGRQLYDQDGRMARQGVVCTEWLAELLAHPYLAKPPPKTTGREEFGVGFAQGVFEAGQRRQLSPEDLVATVTAFTVESIARSYEQFIYPSYRPEEVVLGGGGAYNVTMRQWLQDRLGAVKVLCHEDFGISSDAKEAMLFALLANETLHGIPANVPSATGATHPVILGKVVF